MSHNKVDKKLPIKYQVFIYAGSRFKDKTRKVSLYVILNIFNNLKVYYSERNC